MACKFTNPLEVQNALKNKEHIYDALPFGREQEVLNENLEHSNSVLRTNRDGSKYEIENVSGVEFDRASQVASKLANKEKGNDKGKQSHAATAGTALHAVLETLFRIKGGKVPSKEAQDIVNKFIQDYDVAPGVIEKLTEFANNLYNHFVSVQNGIDPEGKFTIHAETSIMDPVKSLGGTADLIVVFSDGSVGKIDYKFINPSSPLQFSNQQEKILASQGKAIYSTNLNYYKIQGKLLSNILKSHYGVKKMMFDWVVPFQMDLQTHKFENKERVPLDKPKLNFVRTNLDYQSLGNNVSERYALAAIQLESTQIDDKNLKAFILKQTEHLERLEKKINSKLIPQDVKDKYIEQRNRLELSMNAQIFENDLSVAVENINFLIKRFEELQKSYELNKNNDGVLEVFSEALTDIKSQLALFEGINDAYANILNNLTNEKLKFAQGSLEHNKILSQIDKITNNISYINITAADLNAKVDEISYNVVKDLMIDSYYLDENGNIRPFKKSTLMNSGLLTMRDSSNPFFVAFKKIYDRDVLYNVNKKLQEEQKAIVELNDNAKKAGLTMSGLKDILINPKTKNLYGRISRDLFEKIQNTLQSLDSEASKTFLESIYQARDKYKNFRTGQEFDTYEAYFQNKKERQEEFFKSSDVTDKQLADIMDSWEKNNKLFVNGKLNFDVLKVKPDLLQREAVLKPSVLEQNESPEYKRIKSNPAALAWYKYITGKTNELFDIVGRDASHSIQNTFFPWVRKQTAERIKEFGVYNGIRSDVNNMIEGLAVRQDDTHRGVTDDTGLGKDVPIFFINPFLDSEGEIDDTERSYDFGSSMYAFAQTMYNYQYTKLFETKALLLKQVMLDQKLKLVTPMNRKGQPQLDLFGDIAKLPVDLKSFDAKAFDVFLDKYLYGIDVQEQGKDVKVLGKEVNTTKALLTLKNYQTKAQLGFSFIGATAGALNARLNVKFQATKSIYFTPDGVSSAEKAITGLGNKEERKLLAGAVETFLPNTETVYEANKYKVSSMSFNQRINERLLFWGYRKGSEYIDEVILGAMMKNYGWDTESKSLVRLNKPGAKQIKSLSETLKLTDNGVEIEGLSDKEQATLQSEFRAAVKSVSTSIKGEMSSDDVAYYQQHLLGKLVSQYRTWMPGMLKERFGTLKYNATTDALQWGRWNSMASDFMKEEADTMLSYTGKVLLPRLAKIGLDLGTFGLLTTKTGMMERYSDEFLMTQFNKIKESRPDVKMSFEEFKELKQAQYRASMVELRIILGLIALVFATATLADDDDEPLYKENQAVRIALKTISKLQQEMMFSVDPTEGGYLFRNPIPVLGLFMQAKNAVSNGYDEIRDLALGENSKQDKTPFGYYSLRFAVGWNQLRHLLELFDQDKTITGYKK
jgi:hypothetical protein